MIDCKYSQSSTSAESDQPAVSVVCAWYNRFEQLGLTLQSLFSQTFSSFEIILVNDGSTDARVADCLDRHQDKRLKVIHQANKGFTASIRRAIEEARGEFIAIQGAGDSSYPNRLARQFSYLRDHPEIIAVGCARDTLIVGGPQSGLVRQAKGYDKTLWSKEDLVKPKIPFGHGDTMFRASAYRKSGGYRDFFKYAQDRDLWPRMAEHGNFVMMNEALYCRSAFVSEGVGIHPTKQILQSKYMSFALQCARDRNAYGFDLVDAFEDGAGVFARRGSRHVATTTAKKALKHLIHGNDQSAKFLAYLAWRERRTIFVACAVVLVKVALLSSKTRWVVFRILQSFDYDRSQTFEPIK